MKGMLEHLEGSSRFEPSGVNFAGPIRQNAMDVSHRFGDFDGPFSLDLAKRFRGNIGHGYVDGLLLLETSVLTARPSHDYEWSSFNGRPSGTTTHARSSKRTEEVSSVVSSGYMRTRPHNGGGWLVAFTSLSSSQPESA